MNRSEREKLEAEREARRTKRLSERAAQRAKRQAKEAEQAAERAEQLARRARHRRSPRHRDMERSIEDFVDDVADKWSRKAEAWMDDQSKQMFGAGSRDDDYSDGMGSGAYDDDAYGMGGDMDDGGDEAPARSNTESTRRSRRKERARRRNSGIKAARRTAQSWKRRNRNGNLYRNSKNKKICGVCSGIADYWGMETWQVRMMAVFALFIVPSVAVPGYFIAYFLMDDKPYYKQVTDRFHELDDGDDMEHGAPKDHQQGFGRSQKRKTKRNTERRSGSEAKVSNVHNLRAAKQKFADIEERLRSMESHVTSPKFELQRELRKIAGDEA